MPAAENGVTGLGDRPKKRSSNKKHLNKLRSGEASSGWTAVCPIVPALQCQWGLELVKKESDRPNAKKATGACLSVMAFGIQLHAPLRFSAPGTHSVVSPVKRRWQHFSAPTTFAVTTHLLVRYALVVQARRKVGAFFHHVSPVVAARRQSAAPVELMVYGFWLFCLCIAAHHHHCHHRGMTPLLDG